MIWYWYPDDPKTLATLASELERITDTGRDFHATIAASNQAPNYMVRLNKTNAVVVADGEPLTVGLVGASLFNDKFKILKGDYEVHVHGATYDYGSYITVRIGQLKRQNAILCEFCEVRFVNFCTESPALTSFKDRLTIPKCNLLRIQYKSIAKLPFDERHEAVQLVAMLEQVSAG